MSTKPSTKMFLQSGEYVAFDSTSILLESAFHKLLCGSRTGRPKGIGPNGLGSGRSWFLAGLRAAKLTAEENCQTGGGGVCRAGGPSPIASQKFTGPKAD